MFFLSHRKFGQVPSLPYSYQNYLCLNKEEYRLFSFHPRHPYKLKTLFMKLPRLRPQIKKDLTTTLALVNISYGWYNFEQKLRRLRIKKDLTQQQLSEKLGYVTNSYVLDIEAGRFIPSGEKLKKIAKALDVLFKVLEDMLSESRL